ncbi:MAG: hypothetical protein QM535_02810 [Limnohabitans sp.]|nr:hypothetical protein [Limnohabitans sp.]
MKENNYYEIKGKEYNYFQVKLIKQTESHFTVQSLHDKKETQLNNKIYFLRELSILPVHLNRLGFDQENILLDVKGINVFPVYMILGKNIMNLNVAYFGYKVLRNENFSTFKESYLDKFEEIKKISDEDYNNKFREIQKSVKNELGLVLNINELFNELENLNFEIIDKDIIVNGK